MNRRQFITSLVGVAAATAIPLNLLSKDCVKVNNNITLNFRTKTVELHGRVNVGDAFKIVEKTNNDIAKIKDDLICVNGWTIKICNDCNATINMTTFFCNDSNTCKAKNVFSQLPPPKGLGFPSKII